MRAPQTFWVQTAPTQRCAKHPHGSRAVRSFHRRISWSRRAPHSLLSRRAQVPQIRVRRTLRVPPVSRHAPGTLHSETECSGQTLRNRRVWKHAAAGRSARTTSTANMSEDKHTWYRVPARDGDKRQRERYLRDVDLNLETEKLDVEFSHGARLPSRLTGSARKYAETIELDQIRRSTGTDRDTREGVTACVKHVLRSLERAMGMEDATKKGQVQEFFCKKLQRRPGQPMAEWVNVFEKAMPAMKAEELNVELKSMDWHLFEKSILTADRQQRVLGAVQGEYEFAAVREALIKLFPDTLINPVPDRKPTHVTDQKANDGLRNRFKPRDGKTERYTAHETDAHDAEEDPSSESV